MVVNIISSVLVYLIIIGVVILSVRFVAGLYYAGKLKPLRDTTATTLFLITLVALAIFLIILPCVSVGVCSL